MSRRLLTRRALVGSLALGTGGLLAGCDALNQAPRWRETLGMAEPGNKALQRAIGGRGALAREYRPQDISHQFPANGTRLPPSPAYQTLAAQGFAGWQLQIHGAVERPLGFALDQLRAMPPQTQITRHDCVEGWSAIGQWTGVRLAHLLDIVGLKPGARYFIFHCADTLGGLPYYESIDRIDALHPQTMIAWALNGQLLDIAHGAPLRLRVERQLGYKHAKYLTRIEAVESFSGIYRGRGGYWEDVADYEWYAGQ